MLKQKALLPSSNRMIFIAGNLYYSLFVNYSDEVACSNNK